MRLFINAFVVIISLSVVFHGALSFAEMENSVQVASQNVVPEEVLLEEGDENAYRIAPDDKLKIVVFDEKTLSRVYRVGSTGHISVPLIGDVYVQGKTTRDIERELVVRLSDGYLVNPSVSIEIDEYRPFYILGEVRTPGSYSFVNDMSVLNAVALAGGFTYRANKRNVEILRVSEGASEGVKEQPVDASVLPGDIILVRERFF